MKQLYDQTSFGISKLITRNYSTSFSLGIRFLAERFRKPIYAIYGFVRVADEIVDSFHDYNKKELLEKFRADTYYAIDNKISTNPVLNAFQQTVHQYNIERELIDTFLKSMEMDLYEKVYDNDGYKSYILGSAEVVGLMCLRVFTENNFELYEKLKPYAMKLGSAFQKINFLRDVKNDFENLGRTYFPDVNIKKLSSEEKLRIEKEIEQEFNDALKGILLLPPDARFGVYVAYVYYRSLLNKIKKLPPQKILSERVRVPNSEKILLFAGSLIRNRLNMIA
ncbi:MAG: phytoene/squalene synthase family protein [Bacteroidia bacterium]|nr:phytoene/squalene synthase family protein [Bacteroidia bacterium]